jgi:hypothetical protein
MPEVIRGQVKPPPKPKINIATPSHADQFCGEYVTSLYALLTLGGRQGLTFSFSRLNYSDIVVSRNAMLSNWYFNKPDCQHILFLDDDMVAKMPELVVPNRIAVLDDKVDTLVQAFNKIVENGREFSEDASFCKRWAQCGGEVWAAEHRPVRHVGRMTFESKFSDLD